MDISIQAFEIHLGHGITMTQLFDHICATSSTAFDNRYLYLARSDGWWQGLVLTAKDIKAFTRMERAGRRIVLSPQNLGDSELAHFNYFILHEERMRGLFQYYHGAASLNGFGFQLKQKYLALKELMIAQACTEDGVPPTNPPARIKRRYTGGLSYDIVLRRTTFEALVHELREVRNVTLQFTEYTPGIQAFRPLASKASAVRHKLTFRDQYNGAVRDDLIDLSRFAGLRDLRGVGVDQNDVERRFRLLNEPETLGTFDFNEVVLATAFDSDRIPESLANAPMISRLHEIARDDAWCMGRV